jgi:predicted lipoprotein with Yx(FWY)xxD motif
MDGIAGSPAAEDPAIKHFGSDHVKRTCILLIGVLLAAVTVSSVAAAQRGAPTAGAADFFTVQLHKTKLGKVLSTAAGFTLYEFTKDSSKKSACAKISGCLEAWPADQVSGKPNAGPGLKASLLSTIKLPSGGEQVTYAGHPLYIYAGDSGPGQTSYVGAKQFGGTWYALNAKGHAVK